MNYYKVKGGVANKQKTNEKKKKKKTTKIIFRLHENERTNNIRKKNLDKVYEPADKLKTEPELN